MSITSLMILEKELISTNSANLIPSFLFAIDIPVSLIPFPVDAHAPPVLKSD